MAKKHIGLLIVLAGLIFSGLIIVKKTTNRFPSLSSENLKEASFYRQLPDGRVVCELCPNRCILSKNQRGICNVRQNIDGKLYSLVYGKPVSISVDPIEKKPLYHFLPGAKAYSLATAGCNLDCQYCQNWDIAHRTPEELESYDLTPEQVVTEAIAKKAEIIAFTYNEPVVWYEYMLDIAKLAQKKGLKTVIITSGYINPEPLKQLLPYLDVVKIDLKAFNNETYQKLIRGSLEPVLENIKIVHQSGKWLELVHLMVPGWTDNLKETREMCLWIKENVGEEVPLHLSRFWPKYKLLNLPPTPEKTLKEARKICQDVGLKYVYTGNIDDPEGSTTYCPENGQPVVKRRGYFIEENLIDSSGLAPNCPSKIAGVWGK